MSMTTNIDNDANKTESNVELQAPKSIAMKFFAHIFHFGILYISLAIIVISGVFGYTYKRAFEETAAIKFAEQHQFELEQFDKIEMQPLETPFTNTDEVRFVFSYDCAPCRLFHLRWPSITDMLNVEIKVNQLPYPSSRFMTDTILKAHAISEQVHFLDKLNAYLYPRLLEEQETLRTLGQLQDWFNSNGVNNHKFVSYLSNRTTADLLEQYKSFSVPEFPSVLVGGQLLLTFAHDVDDKVLTDSINYSVKNLNEIVTYLNSKQSE